MAYRLRIVVITVFVFLAVIASARAQTIAADSVVRPACAYQFGAGDFVWCVSEAGNIARLTSPHEAEHIRVGSVDEGYVVCSPDGGPYFDTGMSASGWDAPTLVEPPTEDSVRIARTTTDGRFSLLQEIRGNPRRRHLTIRMTLTNNGSATNVRLLRSADLDIDGSRANDVFDSSADAAWARQVHAVSLAALNHNVGHHARVSANLSPRHCGPAAQTILPAVGADLAVSVRYDLGELGAGESAAVLFRYQVY